MSEASLFYTDYTTVEQINQLSEINREPSWITERRMSYFTQFNELPIDQDTLFYKYTNFKSFEPSSLKPSWSLSKNEIALVKDEHQAMTRSMLIENEIDLQIELPNDLQEKGVILGTLANFTKADEELARRIVEEADKLALGFDKLGALASAFATKTLILYIPKNVVVEPPIVRSIHLLKEEIANYEEFIIYLEPNSSVTFVEVLNSTDHSGQSLYIRQVIKVLKDNSRLKYLQVQNLSENTIYISSSTVILDRYAKLISATHLQGGLMTRLNSEVDLSGVGAEAYDLYAKFGNNRQRFDIKSQITHNAPETIGQTHARTVMMGKAESILRGLIVIPEIGVNADSWLTSRGLTIGKGKINAVPSLKIYQNDVKAAHAASVEPINKELIFYLESRGITEANAKEMLIKGYFEYILKVLDDEVLANISRMYLEKKWLAVK